MNSSLKFKLSVLMSSMLQGRISGIHNLSRDSMSLRFVQVMVLTAFVARSSSTASQQHAFPAGPHWPQPGTRIFYTRPESYWAKNVMPKVSIAGLVLPSTFNARHLEVAVSNHFPKILTCLANLLDPILTVHNRMAPLLLSNTLSQMTKSTNVWL